MFVTYKPEDGNPEQVWDFNPKRVRVSEQVIVEKQFEGSWAEFVAGVMSKSAKARRVLLWHLIRREHPAHQFRDTPDFYDDELLIEETFEELTETYNSWVEAGGPQQKDGDVVDRIFQVELEKARRRGDGQGKAPSKSEPADTSGPSASTSESDPGSSENS